MLNLMVVTPESSFLNCSDSNVIHWLVYTDNIDNYAQTHYEILYKFREDDIWLTTGKIESSTTNEYDLKNIYNLVQRTFDELLYRVMVYYTGTNKSGSHVSDAQSVMFHNGKLGTLKYKQAEDNVISAPIFNTDDASIDKVKLKVSNSTIGEIPLFNPAGGKPLAADTELKIKTRDNEVKTLSAEAPTFKPNYFNQNGQGKGYASGTYAYDYVLYIWYYKLDRYAYDSYAVANTKYGTYYYDYYYKDSQQQYKYTYSEGYLYSYTKKKEYYNAGSYVPQYKYVTFKFYYGYYKLLEYTQYYYVHVMHAEGQYSYVDSYYNAYYKYIAYTDNWPVFVYATDYGTYNYNYNYNT